MDEIDHIEMELAEAGEIEEECRCLRASWCAKMPGHDGDCSVVVLRAGSPVAVEQSLTAEVIEARRHIVAQDDLVAKLQQKLDAAEKSAGDAFDIIDAFQTASGLWTDSADPSGVRPKDVAKLIQDQDMRIGAATEILQMLLQSPLGSDDAHKALSMAGAWLVMGEKVEVRS